MFLINRLGLCIIKSFYKNNIKIGVYVPSPKDIYNETYEVGHPLLPYC
jgi:hypothetical protein